MTYQLNNRFYDVAVVHKDTGFEVDYVIIDNEIQIISNNPKYTDQTCIVTLVETFRTFKERLT